MRKSRLALPPLGSLEAFEASARHLSFTRAAAELGVSREAVSRQIRILEQSLGAKLFLRLHRALELTREGADLRDTVSPSLRAIADATERIRQKRSAAKISITASVAIASYWLTPRLRKFRLEHPETEIRVTVSDEPPDLARQNIDVGLRYGHGKWPGVDSVRLFESESFPVCSPDYLANAGPILEPADLTQHTLLNLDGAPNVAEDWSWWLERAGVDPAIPLRFLGFDNYALVIQSALDGQGIAVGFGGIIDGLLSGGGLVRALDRAYSSGGGVYMTLPKGVESGPEAASFMRWITDQVTG